MKKYRIISVIALLLVLITSVPYSAFAAANGNVSYEGGAEKFVFSPGTEMSETSLFPNFEGAMPGDTLTQVVEVVNNSSNSDYIMLYLRAEEHDADSNPLETEVKETEDEISQLDFLAQLHMTVTKGSDGTGEVIYDSTADQTDGLTDNVLLGTFRKGEGTTLVVTLEVPAELGNEYANRAGEVDWIFTAEEYDTHPSIKVEKTVTSSPKNGEAYTEGETIKYSIKVTNDGDVDLIDVVVKDDLTGDEWTIDKLKVGKSKTFTTSYKVTAKDVKKGSVKNTATATGKSSFDKKKVKDKDTKTVSTKQKPIGPPTGDDYTVYIWMAAVALSLIALVVVFLIRRKQKEE